MKENIEMINFHIDQLQNLVEHTKGGLLLAFTSPENDGQTQVISMGNSMSLASNFLALQDALENAATASEGCDCSGCSALRAINEGRLTYDDYKESQKKSTHTFVIDTPEDFKKALRSILKGEI